MDQSFKYFRCKTLSCHETERRIQIEGCEPALAGTRVGAAASVSVGCTVLAKVPGTPGSLPDCGTRLKIS